MKKIVAMTIFQFLFGAGRCQSPILPVDLLKNIKSSRVISFCECVHGSDQLAESQLSFVKELQKYNKIGTIFFESNNLYLRKSKIAAEIILFDSTIKFIGYNPGNLYGSYQLVKKKLANSNPQLLKNIAGILNKIDSNEAYYWYSMEQNQYDSILHQLSLLQVETKETLYQTYISQLKYDLTYLKYRKINGDKIRDSLMFQFIYENISTEKSVKYIIFGHCGHLAKKNPYHTKNLGFYLQSTFSNEFLLIGNDSRSIHVTNNGKFSKGQKKGLNLGQIPIIGTFVTTAMFKKKNQPVYLVGADYNLKRKHKLIYALNYDWLFYLENITIFLSD
jgi:hypothetical protein